MSVGVGMGVTVGFGVLDGTMIGVLDGTMIGVLDRTMIGVLDRTMIGVLDGAMNDVLVGLGNGVNVIVGETIVVAFWVGFGVMLGIVVAIQYGSLAGTERMPVQPGFLLLPDHISTKADSSLYNLRRMEFSSS